MSSKRLEILVERHQELDDKVDALSRQRFLSPRERMQLRNWKVLRLQCRDGIVALQKELAQNAVDSPKEG